MRNEIRRLTIEQVLIYETNTSWWAGYISWPWLQRLAGKYYAAKARRKYARLRKAEVWQSRIDALRLAGLI